MTKSLRLSTGSTRRIKSQRSQSSVGSTSDVDVSEATNENRGDLLVSGMKLRSEKNLDGDDGGNAEAGATTLSGKELKDLKVHGAFRN